MPVLVLSLAKLDTSPACAAALASALAAFAANDSAIVGVTVRFAASTSASDFTITIRVATDGLTRVLDPLLSIEIDVRRALSMDMDVRRRAYCMALAEMSASASEESELVSEPDEVAILPMALTG
jgi:hypothetical protein